jgi:hypothetical protein
LLHIVHVWFIVSGKRQINDDNFIKTFLIWWLRGGQDGGILVLLVETITVFTFWDTHKCMLGSAGIRSKEEIVPRPVLPWVAVSAMPVLFLAWQAYLLFCNLWYGTPMTIWSRNRRPNFWNLNIPKKRRNVLE